MMPWFRPKTSEHVRSDLPTRKVGGAKKPTERGKSRRQSPCCQVLGLGSLGLCRLSCQRQGTMLLYGAWFYFISTTASFATEIGDVMGPNSPKATNKVNVRMCDVRNPRLPARSRSQSATDESLASSLFDESPCPNPFFRMEHGQLWHSTRFMK